MATTVFFRDDDVGALTTPLRNLVELLIEERVPCNYLVIPRYLTPEAARYMCDLRARHPGLIELNQHGYLHEQVIRGVHDYSEFAGGRSYRDQVDAIAEGKKLLQEMLGTDFSPDIFTPPCHKYDANTLRAVRACGFRVFSAGVKADRPARLYYEVGRALRQVMLLGQRVSYRGDRDPKTGLVDLSTSINVDEDLDRHGNRILKSFADLRGEWERAKAAYPIVGVLLHHAQYETTEKVETLRALIRALKSEPAVQLNTLEQIATRLAA